MSSRAQVVAALCVLCTLIGLATGRGMFFNLAYLWGGLLVLAYAWSRSAISGIRLTRQPRSLRAQVGRAFEESLTVENRSRIGKVWLEIRDRSSLPDHQASTVILGLGSHRERSLLVRTICPRRGRFRLGPTELIGGDPFGLFPVKVVVAQTQQVVVLPMIAPLSGFALPHGRLPGGDALMERTHQITPNAAGVRDYMPGDSYSRIHWRSTARRGRLIVKEFELDPLADIWIVLDVAADVQSAMEGSQTLSHQSPILPARISLPPSTLEYGVAAAASLVVHFLQHDRSVGLLAHGKARAVIQPDRGTPQVFRLLETLAVLDGDGQLDLESVLRIEATQLPRGASVILITPSASPALVLAAGQLKRRGLPTALVVLDRESFGGTDGSAALAAAAQHAGMPVRIVRCGDSLSVALSSGVQPGALPTAA
jgi:uncharacterized protein (DUF58 family)